MNTLRWAVIAIVLLGAVSKSGLAFAKEVIHWVDVTIPPYHHIEAEDQNPSPEAQEAQTGITDRLLDLLTEALPEYTHKRTIVPTSRVLRSLEEGQNVCNPAMKITPERQEYIVFSRRPSIIAPSNGIAIRVKDRNRFGEPPVALERLMSNPDLVLGVEFGRAYGRDIDQLLALHKGSDSVYQRFSSPAYSGLIRMLTHKRVDYVLGFPMEFSYVEATRELGRDIAFLPIRESSEFSYSYIGCSKTATGRQLIVEIDKALARIRKTEAYREAIERWLPTVVHESFRRHYREDFLTQQRPIERDDSLQ
ncbi:TIGR02285 family protein [Marinobacter sp. CHS3-4]|uniref:TIGR02285 family protein n=1 Tax=Marinobacter sp. CHS3-4 TaxID=3045174 RepID=UPI0024B4B685|nr:TIGR02285 family protein [Marinobacter sp. CHS3-4]MDI9244233.1 TIGR02285 family protein [Marinobacter sp. CHS3-4]